MTDPTSLPNFSLPPQERPLVERVLEALTELQLDPVLDQEGDVAFEARDQRMFVKVAQGDQFDVMRVFGQWQIADTVPEDLATRLNGCNDVTLGVNLVKAGIAGGNLILAVEQIIARPELPKAKLQIATGLILQSLPLWHRNVIAKARVEQGLDPELPEGTPEGTTIGPWLSLVNTAQPTSGAPEQNGGRPADPAQDGDR